MVLGLELSRLSSTDKDIAAAAAGISILVWAAILLLEVIRLFQLNT